MFTQIVPILAAYVCVRFVCLFDLFSFFLLVLCFVSQFLYLFQWIQTDSNSDLAYLFLLLLPFHPTRSGLVFSKMYTKSSEKRRNEKKNWRKKKMISFRLNCIWIWFLRRYSMLLKWLIHWNIFEFDFIIRNAARNHASKIHIGYSFDTHVFLFSSTTKKNTNNEQTNKNARFLFQCSDWVVRHDFYFISKIETKCVTHTQVSHWPAGRIV